MEYDYIGAIKVKDGLFLGDQFAAQDLEFIVTNKVSRIVNCAGKQIPNHWESIGIQYLSYPWLDNESQAIFQTDDGVLQATKFIEDALNVGESVIVHSVRGHNRSIVVLCVYFMRKYRWTLYKTLQYMHSRRPDLEIRANFFNQMLALESRFQKNGHGAKTYNWDEVFAQGDPDEVVLRNTYLNAQSQGVAEFKDNDVNRVKHNKLTFAEKVLLFIPPYDKVTFSKKKQPAVAPNSAKTILKHTKDHSHQDIPTAQPVASVMPPLQQHQPQHQPQPQPQLQPIAQPMPQRPASQDMKRVNKSDSQKIQLLPEATQSWKPKKNNFVDSGEQFFLKTQQLNPPQQPAVANTANSRRPQTAPNQLRAPRLQVTPYKRNTSQGKRNEALVNQPASQFRPIGNRQRAQSPNQAYQANPYAQKQFKQKPWKK